MDNEEQFNEASQFLDKIFENLKQRDNFYPKSVNEQNLEKFQKLSVLAKVFEKQYNDHHDLKIVTEILPPSGISSYGFVSLTSCDDTDAEIEFTPDVFNIVNDMMQLSDAMTVDTEMISYEKHDVKVSLIFTVDNILE